jgi:hypothetical protein
MAISVPNSALRADAVPSGTVNAAAVGDAVTLDIVRLGFCTHPKALNEVAVSLAQPFVLKKLLTVPSMYEPPGEEVQVPAICGGGKLVDSAFSMERVSLRRHDLCRTLADSFG